MTRAIRGRYAPSPSGDLHLGNASTALLAWLSARSRGGTFVLRVEDIDVPRVRPGAAERILDDLRWLGLDWDEGPDVSGPCAPYVQSERLDRYEAAFARLAAAGAVYPCFCSRKEIASSASAPQSPGDEVRYPGTCRRLGEDDAARRLGAGELRAWRFRVPGTADPGVDDLVRGPWRPAPPLPPGDFVVRRAAGTPSYQLAVAVDDAAMRITEVVRGDDLLPSAVRQRLVLEALAAPVPVFAHVPLLIGPDGARLSKRHEATAIADLRSAGLPADTITGRLARLLGLRDSAAPVLPADLLDGFSFSRLRPAPSGIPVDPREWI